MRKLSALPAWLEFSHDRTHGLEVPTKTSIIQRIFKEAADGLGSYAIASRFNEEGVPAIGSSAVWHASSIDNIICNRAVLGEFRRYRSKDSLKDPSPIFGIYPRIIADELFEAAQSHRRGVGFAHRKGRKGKTYSNLFGTTLHCGTCANRMRLAKDNGIQFAACPQCRISQKPNALKYKYEWLERAMLDFLTSTDNERLQELIKIAQSFDEDPYARRYKFSLVLQQAIPLIFVHRTAPNCMKFEVRLDVPKSSCSLLFDVSPLDVRA